MDDQSVRDLVGRVEGLLDEVDALPERDKVLELVQALVEMYGEGLHRIMDLADGTRDALAGDELVAHLLLLHDLHPVPVEGRVQAALEEVRPYLESHGGDVDLIGVDTEGVVHLRLQGSCAGCPASAMTLKLAIEDAIHKAAPDIERVEAEGVAAKPKAAVLEVQIAGGPPGDWKLAGSLVEIASGGAVVKRVAGEEILFARLGDTYYGYRRPCPGCEEPLGDAALQGTELVCPACARRYDALRAGRCLESPQLYLEPVPLLVTDSGLVKVALGAAVA